MESEIQQRILNALSDPAFTDITTDESRVHVRYTGPTKQWGELVLQHGTQLHIRTLDDVRTIVDVQRNGIEHPARVEI